MIFAQQSPADVYCTYLQEKQVKALEEKKKLNALESLINFVNDLTKKLTLNAIEKEALEKKMSFESFQEWAKTNHSIIVNDHYKAKYLENYIKTVCGEITYSATFGATPEPETSASAEKQFDPTGYPYSSEVKSLPKPNKEETGSVSNPTNTNKAPPSDTTTK